MFSRIKEVAVAVPCSESRKSASAHSPVEEGLVVKADDECGGAELVDRFPELPLDLQWRIDSSFSHRLNSTVRQVDWLSSVRSPDRPVANRITTNQIEREGNGRAWRRWITHQVGRWRSWRQHGLGSGGP